MSYPPNQQYNQQQQQPNMVIHHQTVVSTDDPNGDFAGPCFLSCFMSTCLPFSGLCLVPCYKGSNSRSGIAFGSAVGFMIFGIIFFIAGESRRAEDFA